MKNIITILALLLSVPLSAQKYVQVFSKEGGIQIGISLSDIAFIAPSNVDGGSVIVLGPNPRVINVTDTLANIIDSSASMLIELTEIYNNAGAQRQIGVSRQHIKEVVPDGNSQTLLRLRSPFNSIKVAGAFSVIADSLAAESGGGGTADGNGIYSGSDTIPVATLATITESGGSSMDFGLGVFNNWNNFNPYDTIGGTFGLFFGNNDWGSIGIKNDNNMLEAYPGDDGIYIGAQNRVGSTGSEFYAYTSPEGTAKMRARNNLGNIDCQVVVTQSQISLEDDGAITINIGTGSPEGVITAEPGSIFFRKDGGAGTTLYIKETGSGNTGWTAK